MDVEHGERLHERANRIAAASCVSRNSPGVATSSDDRVNTNAVPDLHFPPREAPFGFRNCARLLARRLLISCRESTQDQMPQQVRQ